MRNIMVSFTQGLMRTECADDLGLDEMVHVEVLRLSLSAHASMLAQYELELGKKMSVVPRLLGRLLAREPNGSFTERQGSRNPHPPLSASKTSGAIKRIVSIS